MNPGIEIRHLRYFVALAEELHFGRAAERCHVSQPPFSVTIRQLETQLGFPLVERSTREVRLTAAGAAYYAEAARVLAQATNAEDIARRVADGARGVLKVGFFASMLNRGLERAARRFEAEVPDVVLHLVELSTADQLPALLARQIHYGFIHSASVMPPTVASVEVLREGFVLCVPEAHALAGRGAVDLAELAAEPFVLFGRNVSPAYYDQVVSQCVAAGFHPRILHEARHWLTVLGFVSKGMGVTLVPRSLAGSRFHGVAFVDIGDTGVKSVVQGIWLREEEGSSTLAIWRRAAEAEI